jgi:hypothetical protein
VERPILNVVSNLHGAHGLLYPKAMIGFAVWLITASACFANAETRAAQPQEHALISYLLIGLAALVLVTPTNGLHFLGKYVQFYRASAEKDFRRGVSAGSEES